MALSISEMKLIRSHLGGRMPTALELNIFENLWSEHCSYRHSRPFVKRYAQTHVFGAIGVGENAGGVKLPSGKELFFKIESHNHPSFIEPREGAATGVGGILRDVFAMGARPIMIGDLLCFGDPTRDEWMRHLVTGVVDGISSYGNSVGIANAGGDTQFHPAYQKNILVNVFSLGIRESLHRISSKVDPKLHAEVLEIHLIGGRTGCDGIGGAAMASETFTPTAVQKKRHHVQIGDPYMEKRIMDISLALLPHVAAIQDCGAAGLTSSLFEICHKNECGGVIHLDRVPLRNKSPKPEEIMVSESQERMVLIATPSCAEIITQECRKWDVPHAVIGQLDFKSKKLAIMYQGQCLTQCDPVFVCEGHMHLYDYVQCQAQPKVLGTPSHVCGNFKSLDLKIKSQQLMNSLKGCDRRWIYQQYDQHVGGRTVLSPSQHPVSIHVASVDVSEEKATQEVVGVRLSQSPELFALNPYVAAWQSVKEGVMQLWAAKLSPIGLTNGLNFASPEDPKVLQSMDAATLGIKDACMHYQLPVVSGNVSLYNQFGGQSGGAAILPTVALGFVGAGRRADVKYLTQQFPQQVRIYALTSTQGSALFDPTDLTSAQLDTCLMQDKEYGADLKKVFQKKAVLRAFFPYLKPIWNSFLPWMLRNLIQHHLSLEIDKPEAVLGIGCGVVWVVVPADEKIEGSKHMNVGCVGEVVQTDGATTCMLKVKGKNMSLAVADLRECDQSAFLKQALGK